MDGEFGLKTERQRVLSREAPQWILAPVHALPARVRWMLVAFVGGMTLLASAWLQRTMGPPFGPPDAPFYVQMAKGQMAGVPQPFASRVLAPMLVRALGVVTHISVETGFRVLGWSSLLFTLGVVLWLATLTGAPRWMLLVIAAVPFWPQLLHGIALPDLPYAALLCCLLLCLRAERPYLAALMMFPLMLARESTSLTLICLLLVGWRWLRLGGCVVAVAAALAGSLVVARLGAGAGGNPEHLPIFVYLAAKLPWNLARTLGVVPWSNLYPFLCGTPRWRYALHLGSLHTVGVCGFSEISPFQAALALLTTFGVMPSLLVLVWKRRDRIRGPRLLQRFCLLYGGLSFALAPMIGTWYTRLFGYGWPLFLVALPGLFPVVPMNPGKPSLGRGVLAVWATGGLIVVQLALGVTVFLHPEPVLALWDVVLQAAAVALFWWSAGVVLRPSE